MRPRLPSSVLVLSVDWNSSPGAGVQREAFTADKLIRLLQRYELATTWSLPDPHGSPIPELLHESRIAHDVSLLGCGSWVAPGVERRCFGEQLQARVVSARHRGIDIRALAMPSGQAIPHVDLVQKSEIRSVRMDDQRPQREQSGTPYALKYGLWNLPVNRTLPEHQHWIWSPTGSNRRMIQSVMAGQVAHFVIAGDRFAGQKLTDLRNLEMVLRNLSEAQQMGRLSVETVSQFVSRLGAPQRHSARSILHKAA